MINPLFILILNVGVSFSQISSHYEFYKSVPIKGKLLISNTLKLSLRETDSLLKTDKIDIRIQEVINQDETYYIIRFRDKLDRIYIFTIYQNSGRYRKHSQYYYERHSGIPYYIAGFDTCYTQDYRKVRSYFKSIKGYTTLLSLYKAHDRIDLFDKKKALIQFRKESKSKVKIRKIKMQKLGIVT